MKRIQLQGVKKVHYPFYQANIEKEKEVFYDDDYQTVWDEAEEMGLQFKISERVEILKQVSSVYHLYWQGIDYFYNMDFDAYWEELALLLEEKFND